MNYLLDTNICIHFFRGKFNLLDKFQKVNIQNCAISEITLAELVFGAENSDNPKKTTNLLIDSLNRLKYCQFIIPFPIMQRKRLG